MARDWVKFPELRNSEMATLYFESPHRQITENFEATVVKVIDGDTVRVLWEERDFDFPVRIIDINAAELETEEGQEAQEFLESEILGHEVEILVDSERRVGKWGRILGRIINDGFDLGQLMIATGRARRFDDRTAGEIPNIEKFDEVKL